MSGTSRCVTIVKLLTVAEVFLLFLEAVSVTATTERAECQEPHRQLIEEYKTFHNANKYSPDAQYLVHTCWERQTCAGTGDRIRGALWLLRVAITYKKILLVDWERPGPLTEFLVPNEVDWTLTGFNASHFHVDNTLSTDDFNDAVYRQVPSAVEKFRATKTYHTNTNQHFDINIMVGITPINDLHRDGSCYFRLLFKPHQDIVRRGEEHLQQLYGFAPTDYVAWHWRHYDIEQDTEKCIKISELHRTLNCAQELAQTVGLDTYKQPILLLTDFHGFRQMVGQGEFRRLVTPAIVPRYIDRGEHPHADYVGIFVDLYLMSRGRCLLISRSGFSDMAVWMGGIRLLTCNRPMHC